MSRARTLSLLGLVVACLVLVLFLDIRRGAPEGHGRLFPGLTVESVRGLKLVSKESTVFLEREDSGGWRLSRPYRMKADASEIESRLSRLELAAVDRVIEIESGASRAEFGLSPPERFLEVKTVSGERFTVAFGRRNPSGQWIYASRDTDVDGRGGAPVLLVAANLDAALDPDLSLLVERRLFPLSRLEFDAMEIAFQDRTKVLLTPGDPRWRMTRPFSDWVSREASEALDALLHAQGEPAPAPDRAARVKKALHAPDWIVNLSAAGSVPSVLRVARLDGKTYAHREGEAGFLVLDHDLLEPFPKSPSAWRERRIVLSDSWNVVGLVYSFSTGTVRGTRDPSSAAWSVSFSGAAATPTSGAAVTDTAPFARGVEDLAGLSAIDVVDETPELLLARGFSPSGETIHLEVEGGTTEVIEVGKSSGRNRYVRPLSRGWIGRVPDALLEAILSALRSGAA